MNEPNWLSQEEVDRLHRASIEMAGGSRGVRDIGLLLSALARPKNLYAYGEKNIFQLAASYAEGISRNHPFIDGNKRTGFASAGGFLLKNGCVLQPGKGDNHAKMIEDLAQGKITREVAGDYLKNHSSASQ